MAIPLVPLVPLALKVLGTAVGGTGIAAYLANEAARKSTREINAKSNKLRQSVDKAQRKQMQMFEDMGIDTATLKDENGEIDPAKVDEAYAQAREAIKKRGGPDLPEDATLTDLHNAYRKSDPARSPQPAGAQPAGAQPTVVKNGAPQAGKGEGKGEPLKRREIKAPADPTVTPVRKPTTSGVVAVDGIPDLHQTETRGKLEAAARNKAAVLEANSNTMRKDAQYAERQADANREVQAIRDAVARRSDILNRERQRNAQIDQDAERRRQERADARFKNRTLSNREDWENLGRDYTKAAEGETPEQLKAAQDKRNGRLAALRDRIAEMTDTTLLKKGETGKWENGKMVVRNANGNVVNAKEVASRKTTGVGDDLRYANETYANAPGRMRQAQEFKKLMESAGNNITDAQMDALEKGLGKWKGEADARAERAAVQQKLRDTERIWGLREKYGMHGSAFSNKDVENMHKSVQAQQQKKILQDMDVALGQGDDAGRADRMERFSNNWEKLVKSGFDVSGTFDKAMSNPVNKQAYTKGLASIAPDDPEAADKRDQLRRRFIMNQAMYDAGLDDKRIRAPGKEAGDGQQRLNAYANNMAAGLPGNQGATAMAAAGSIQAPNIVDALRAKQSAQQPSESLESQIGVARQMAEEQRLTGQDMIGQGKSSPAATTEQDIEAQELGSPQSKWQSIKSAVTGDMEPSDSYADSGSGERAYYAKDGTYLGSDMPDGSRKLPEPIKKRETQQAVKGGDALRPRRRR